MVTCATIDKASHSAESFVLITSADPARLRTATLKYQIFQAAGQNLVDWQS